MNWYPPFCVRGPDDWKTLVNSREFWPQLNVACTFPGAVDPDGVEREVDAAVDGGALLLVLTLSEVVGEWLTA